MLPESRRPQSGHGTSAHPNRLTALLKKWFLCKAVVHEAHAIASGFRAFTLVGPDLKDVDWVPGQKLQLDVGGGFRTFTPITWDRASGETRILVFTHGETPASRWASRLRQGDECHFFGPRASLDLTAASGEQTILFGDETSLGLALARQYADTVSRAHFLFEVSSPESSECAWQALGGGVVQFVLQKPDDAHLHEVEDRALSLLRSHPAARFVLTGRASSIQRMNKFLRTHGAAGSQIKTKAYWAPGKIGLD